MLNYGDGPPPPLRGRPFENPPSFLSCANSGDFCFQTVQLQIMIFADSVHSGLSVGLALQGFSFLNILIDLIDFTSNE
jgi:hypothetical protein